MNLAFYQEEKALFEKKDALLKEQASIRSQSDRMLRDSLTPSDLCTCVHDTIREKIMVERIETGDDEAADGGQE